MRRYVAGAASRWRHCVQFDQHRNPRPAASMRLTILSVILKIVAICHVTKSKCYKKVFQKFLQNRSIILTLNGITPATKARPVILLIAPGLVRSTGNSCRTGEACTVISPPPRGK